MEEIIEMTFFIAIISANMWHLFQIDILQEVCSRIIFQKYFSQCQKIGGCECLCIKRNCSGNGHMITTLFQPICYMPAYYKEFRKNCENLNNKSNFKLAMCFDYYKLCLKCVCWYLKQVTSFVYRYLQKNWWNLTSLTKMKIFDGIFNSAKNCWIICSRIFAFS